MTASTWQTVTAARPDGGFRVMSYDTRRPDENVAFVTGPDGTSLWDGTLRLYLRPGLDVSEWEAKMLVESIACEQGVAGLHTEHGRIPRGLAHTVSVSLDMIHVHVGDPRMRNVDSLLADVPCDDPDAVDVVWSEARRIARDEELVARLQQPGEWID